MVTGFNIRTDGTDYDNRTWYTLEFVHEDGSIPRLGAGYQLGDQVKLDGVETGIIEITWSKDGDFLQHVGYWVPFDTDPAIFTSFWQSLDQGEESPQPLIINDYRWEFSDLGLAITAFQQDR